MKKILYFFVLCIHPFCNAYEVAASPILFKGLNDVPFDFICKDVVNISSFDKNEGICSLKIKEYAGQLLLDEKENLFRFSSATFDRRTKKITGIMLAFGYYNYSYVKEVITEKFGKPQTNRYNKGDWWYGDESGSTFFSLVTRAEDGGSSNLMIITPEMRKARNLLHQEMVSEAEERDRKAKIDKDFKLKKNIEDL